MGNKLESSKTEMIKKVRNLTRYKEFAIGFEAKQIGILCMKISEKNSKWFEVGWLDWKLRNCALIGTNSRIRPAGPRLRVLMVGPLLDWIDWMAIVSTCAHVLTAWSPRCDLTACVPGCVAVWRSKSASGSNLGEVRKWWWRPWVLTLYLDNARLQSLYWMNV